MALIFAIIIIVVIFFYSPIVAGVVALLSIIYFYKSFQRTKYMTDEEVDMAIRLKTITDPEERKKIKSQIEENINKRMAEKK